MSDVPDWLRELAESVCERIVPAVPNDSAAAVACHTNFAEGVWEVTLFVDRSERVGGAADGRATRTPYFLDLLGLTDTFETVERFSWQPLSLGKADDLGAHVAIEGRHAGHTVWLRVLAEVPRHFGTGRFSPLYDA